MDRKVFIRNGLLGTGIFVASNAVGSLIRNDIDELKKLETLEENSIVGFNHLPNTTSKIMTNTVLHKAETRGHANHGWLNSHHTFSFANYYNPERMHFGVLRVLNDDIVRGGNGFGRHPHDNMEIISIPLEGDLEHQDSMGNIAVIKNGDIQVMSAGTGITHSEKNKSLSNEVKFLQIWIFPNKKNVEPRYDQLTLNAEDRKNKLQQILSPSQDDDGVWIHQDAWFHLGSLDEGNTQTYQLKKEGNGIYIFVINGEITVQDQKLNTRDGFGIWDVSEINISAGTNAEVLIMEVPMKVG
ncbi:MAG TPA: pirin family protein [Saprospiraceae bacterium]|nr:pirin family protein [Saprospiraceae bacterium]HMU03544.1 pirin family protein [Saprospiraceae bacterium]